MLPTLDGSRWVGDVDHAQAGWVGFGKRRRKRGPGRIGEAGEVGEIVYHRDAARRIGNFKGSDFDRCGRIGNVDDPKAADRLGAGAWRVFLDREVGESVFHHHVAGNRPRARRVLDCANFDRRARVGDVGDDEAAEVVAATGSDISQAILCDDRRPKAREFEATDRDQCAGGCRQAG
jgi:hypothetical protein